MATPSFYASARRIVTATTLLHNFYVRAQELDVPDELHHSKKSLLMYGLVAAILVLAGGVMAGLTIGLMGLSTTHLKVLSMSSTSYDTRKNATKVLDLLNLGRHWVLVCLLMTNVIINEALPIFLDSLMGDGVQAVISSTVLILVFGEVLPQACCNRYGLSIGAACARWVKLLMYIEAPIVYPIAAFLDHVLGVGHGERYDRKELATFVGLQEASGRNSMNVGNCINTRERTLVENVLSLYSKPLEEIMVPTCDMFTLRDTEKLDEHTIAQIVNRGYSRIPVLSAASRYLGYLEVKHIALLNPADQRLVGSITLSPLAEAHPQTRCLDALDFFKSGHPSLMIITTTPGTLGERGTVGLVTLEDLNRAIIGDVMQEKTPNITQETSTKKAGIVLTPPSLIKGHNPQTDSISNSLSITTSHSNSTRSRSKSSLHVLSTPNTNIFSFPPSSHHPQTQSQGVNGGTSNISMEQLSIHSVEDDNTMLSSDDERGFLNKLGMRKGPSGRASPLPFSTPSGPGGGRSSPLHMMAKSKSASGWA